MSARGEKAGGGTPVTVRRMSTLDITGALSILESSPEAALWSRDSLLHVSSRGNAWAAEVEGCVAGILIGRIAADEFEILNLAVGKAHRRRGIATELLTAALEYARIAGAAKTYLEVRVSNQGAIAFYSRMGFRDSGSRAKYYRDPVEDAILLVLPKSGTTS